MTKPLTRIADVLYHYSDGQRHEGRSTGLTGDCSGLTGDFDDIPASARPCSLADWTEAP